MEYRQLPHGTSAEKFSVLGLGLGGIGKTPADEIEAVIRKGKALLPVFCELANWGENNLDK